LIVPEDSLLHPIIAFWKEIKKYSRNKCLLDKDSNLIATFKNYNNIKFQTLLSFEKKIMFNNQFPIEFYNQLNKYTFYSSGKSKKHWGFFLCNFENNEPKYEEVSEKSDDLTIDTYYNKYLFLYNVEGEFC
jgi:hypothetical protein